MMNFSEAALMAVIPLTSLYLLISTLGTTALQFQMT